MPKAKTKVIIVDDSALIRAVLTEILNSDERLEVVACARDPYEARELIKQHKPDVLTLDIEMPKMNGIAFLKNLMRLRPMPVVMISTLTQEGAPLTLEALELGAVDFLGKPQDQGDSALEQYRHQITEKVYWASKARVRSIDEAEQQSKQSRISAAAGKKLKPNFLCAIGASTGGTEAIKEVIQGLPEESPPIVITQHIPAVFSSSFARRLDSLSALKVYEAEEGQAITPGSVFLAPGNSHLRVVKTARGYVCRLGQDDPVNRHRPSVEVLFDSVIAAAGSNSMGVLLTGMGADGAEALLRMRQAGCVTAAQDEETSVVWGMPGVAVRIGAANKVLPLTKVGRFILMESFK